MVLKQTLLLMVLALGMCSDMGFAQKKEYHVEDDGFEWYKLRKYENGQSSPYSCSHRTEC